MIVVFERDPWVGLSCLFQKHKPTNVKGLGNGDSLRPVGGEGKLDSFIILGMEGMSINGIIRENHLAVVLHLERAPKEPGFISGKEGLFRIVNGHSHKAWIVWIWISNQWDKDHSLIIPHIVVAIELVVITWMPGSREAIPWWRICSDIRGLGLLEESLEAKPPFCPK